MASEGSQWAPPKWAECRKIRWSTATGKIYGLVHDSLLRPELHQAHFEEAPRSRVGCKYSGLNKLKDFASRYALKTQKAQ